MSGQRSVKLFLVRFYENTLIVSQVVTCAHIDGQMGSYSNRRSSKILTHVKRSTIIPRLFRSLAGVVSFGPKMIQSFPELTGQ
jgi:hypothetical protein